MPFPIDASPTPLWTLYKPGKVATAEVRFVPIGFQVKLLIVDAGPACLRSMGRVGDLLPAEPMMTGKRALAAVALTYWIAIAILAFSDALIPAGYLTMPSWYVVSVMVVLIGAAAPTVQDFTYSWGANVLWVLLSATLNIFAIYWVALKSYRDVQPTETRDS